VIWTAGACAVCLCICMPLYMYYKHQTAHLHLACCYKVLGTLCAFLMALIAAVRLDPRCWILAAGLLFYTAADYTLEFNFTLGAGLFLAGHVINIPFFLNLAPPSAVHLVSLLILGGMGCFVFYSWRKAIGKQMKFFIVYGVSLLLMVVCAVGCFMMNSLMGILIAAGGMMFYLSDFFLMRRILFPAGRLISWVIMTTYYSALLLFGIASLLI